MIPIPLRAMGEYRQFMLYKIVGHNKFPFDYMTNTIVNAHDSKYWMDYDTAEVIVEMYGEEYGIAFVFTNEDPFFFVDIDNCVGLSNDMVNIFDGAAIEISRSSVGLHIFGSYNGLMPAHGCKNNGIEFYHTGRFVALTGMGIIGDCSKDFTDILPSFIAGWIPHDENMGSDEWTDEACNNNRLEDEELINKALNAKGAAAIFGGRTTFADLWNCNVEALHKYYPDNYGNRDYDASQVDSALAQHLAFWTGKNCERIEKLMKMSALVREKWNREYYMHRTILGAVRRCTEVYTNLDNSVKKRTVNIFMSPDMQIELFNGCVYIEDLNKIMVSDGTMLNAERFKVRYGGRRFVIDQGNTKTTDDAWLAFTQSQVYDFPKVKTPAFKPLMTSGEIFTKGGTRYINTYYPLKVKREPGDIKPFLLHLEKILPDKRDAIIFLSYMAACVQHRGIKFQWAPLLQGVEGNGKTLFTQCVAEAIGAAHVHWPKAAQLGSPFNAWMLNKLFFAVEDVYSPKNKYEIWEDLKPMITGGCGIEIQAKGIDQISVDICGNFMFNTNHKSALPKTNNDRRLCVLFTAQQTADDLIRDGMDGDYFPKLYNWCKNGGFAKVTDYLNTYKIREEFNPATKCHRAPITSTTNEAINAGRGDIELEITEAIASGRRGFSGGWVSIIMLDRLLIEIGKKRLNINIKIKILESMGYIPHPGLIDGRTDGIVMPDAARTKLFIHKNSPYVGLIDGITAIYEQCNS